MQMEKLRYILKTTHLILTKLTVYYIDEKVIICYLHDSDHGNKTILEMLSGFAVSSIENLNMLIFFYSDK